MVEGVDVLGQALGVLVDDQFPVILLRCRLAHGVHVAELPAGIDMQQREGRLGGIEGLEREMQHDSRILADRIEHHRLFAFGRHLAHDMDRFRLEPFEMGQVLAGGAVNGPGRHVRARLLGDPAPDLVDGAGGGGAALPEVEHEIGVSQGLLAQRGRVYPCGREISLDFREKGLRDTVHDRIFPSKPLSGSEIAYHLASE